MSMFGQMRFSQRYAEFNAQSVDMEPPAAVIAETRV